MTLRTSLLAATSLPRAVRAAAICGVLSLTACANISGADLFPDFGGSDASETAVSTAPKPDAIETQALPQQAVDPLNAPPPDAMTAGAGDDTGSQRVALGTLTTADLATPPAGGTTTPQRRGPAPLVPSAQTAPSQPSAPASTTPTVAASQPAAVTASQAPAQAGGPSIPAALPPLPGTAPPPAAPRPATPTPPTVAAVAPTPTPTPTPAVAVQAPVPPAQVMHDPPLPSAAAPAMVAMPAPVARPSGEFVPDAAVTPPSAIDEPREFVPAQIGSTAPLGMAPGSVGAPRLAVGDSNVIRRFQALSLLLDDGLITQEEYDKRRAANAGAMLPYSKPPPGIGLDRAVPSPQAIAARLQALGRSLEMRAITPRQHSLERITILNSLMPERPDPRAPKAAPPTDMFAAADAAARLAYLRDEDLITEAEFEAEKDAMDRLMRGGDAPIERKSMTSATSAAAKAAGEVAAPAAAQTPDAPNDPLASQKFRGPVLHLASFRTEQAARNAYAQAIAKNPAQFTNLKPEYRKTDLGEKQGIFYRLLVGPFETMAEAEAACIEMKKVDQFCRATPDGS